MFARVFKRFEGNPFNCFVPRHPPPSPNPCFIPLRIGRALDDSKSVTIDPIFALQNYPPIREMAERRWKKSLIGSEPIDFSRFAEFLSSFETSTRRREITTR